MVLTQTGLKRVVYDGVKKTVNRFRERPYIFFTEMDIHCYLYRCLYGEKLEVRTKDDLITTCVHKEYPTNFRYSKKTMQNYGLNKVGRRGNYDLAILNPSFIAESDMKNVVNKDVRDLEARSRNKEKFRDELIAAIELKFVINNNHNFVDEIEKDAKKLSIGLKNQKFDAYNLVFCNCKYHYMPELKELVENTDQSIKSLLAVSYYVKARKITPKPITNGWSV